MAAITDTIRARLADPDGRRYVSPLGARRERAVACQVCKTDTYALDGLCDQHAIAKFAHTITHLTDEAAEALL